MSYEKGKLGTVRIYEDTRKAYRKGNDRPDQGRIAQLWKGHFSGNLQR